MPLQYDTQHPGTGMAKRTATVSVTVEDAAAPTAALTVEFNGSFLSSPQGIALDAANGRALVIDSTLDAVVAVELTSGDRVIVSK